MVPAQILVELLDNLQKIWLNTFHLETLGSTL